MPHNDSITRREALRRTALVMGAALASSTVAAADSALWAATPGWAPRTLSADQLETIATIAEHIIPATDTPGARAAGVHRLVDVMLSDYYGAAERDRFLAGIAALDQRAQRAHRLAFVQCTAHDRIALLTALDAEAYPPKQVLAKAEPENSEIAKMRDSLARPGSTTATSVQPPSASVDGATEAVQHELETGWFFRRMKEVTLLGYYTSQIGSTRELGVAPMGAYHGDIAYRGIGHGWA